MKIFLTGASGFVGAAFAEAAHRRGHRVIGVVRQAPLSVPGLAQQLSFDLTDSAALTSALFEHFPDTIVNCAAVAEPAQCETDPVRSEALNVAGIQIDACTNTELSK